MGVIGSVSGIFNALAKAREALKVAWSLPPARASDAWLDMYHKSPMLDPVHMIASDVAGSEFSIYNKAQFKKDPQNAEPISDHIIQLLFDNPMPDHPEIDKYAIFYLTDAYYEIVGDAFWLLDWLDDNRRKPAGIYPIPPTWVLATPTMTEPWYRIQPMGNTSHRYYNADPQDIVWFKAPNVQNPYGRGRARGEAIGDEIDTHEYSAKYAKNFFYNDAVPPIILEMPGISEPNAKKFKSEWKQKLGGFLNAREPGVVAQKDFKVHQLVTSQREMDFTESRKYLIQIANEHWSVPPEMRGNLQNSNRSTIDSAYYLWSKNVVSKRLRLFESTINRQFVPIYDKNAYWKYNDVVPEDKEAMMRIANDGLKNMTITRNEWRAIASQCGVKLPPDNARGDFYLGGIMIQETPAFKKSESIEAPEDKPAIEEPKPAEDQETIDLDKAIKELGTATKKLIVKDGLSKEARVKVWTSFDTKAVKAEPPFKKVIQQFSAEQKKKVVAAVKDIEKPEDVKAALGKVFDKSADTALASKLGPAWLLCLHIGRDHALDLIGSGKAYRKDDTESITNSFFSAWVKKNGLIKANGINETTNDKLLKKLQDEIGSSIDAGESLGKRMERIQEVCDGVYDEMDKSRAEKIARTESGTTINAGSYATYKAEGIGKKEWIGVPDDRQRESHSEADGQIVGIDEKFDVGGEQLEYPGDPAGSAANTVQCRCTLAPVVEED
jgi:HK97 family phage portal protein